MNKKISGIQAIQLPGSIFHLLYRYPVFFILVFAGFFTMACEGDYRRMAKGSLSEVIVVMDSTRWNGPVGEVVREVFSHEMMTLPRPENRYDLRFMDLRTNRDLDFAKNHRNTIFVGPIDEDSNVGAFIRAVMSDEIQERIRDGRNFAFPLHDRWYRDQWTLFLSAESEEMLAQKIRQNRRSLLNQLDQIERERWIREVYRRGEQKQLSEEMMERHGFQIRVQHDYRMGVDTTGFLTMRRFLPDNDRWIWIAYKEGFEGLGDINREWIHAVRDSLNRQYIRGTREESYVTTDHQRLIEMRDIQVNGRPALEVRGSWRMSGDAMGGPFLNYVIFDEHQDRIYLMEFGQFAPRYPKRRFLNQFEAIAHTFETDESANPVSEAEADPAH